MVPKWYSALITIGWNIPIIRKEEMPIIRPVKFMCDAFLDANIVQISRIGRHSWIKVLTGFLVAAFQLWLMTESREMASVISAASTMAHHGKSILL